MSLWASSTINTRSGLAVCDFKAVSQLLWPDKDREEWFSLGENHERRRGFGLHQLRNCMANSFWHRSILFQPADQLLARQRCTE
jgi:hypothetical protein